MKIFDCNIPKKMLFRASKRFRKFRTQKTAKISKLRKLSESYFEPAGKGGWPPISIWIIIDPRWGCPSFYGKNGIKAHRGWCWVKDKIHI
jgi:hypothetical protein